MNQTDNAPQPEAPAAIVADEIVDATPAACLMSSPDSPPKAHPAEAKEDAEEEQYFEGYASYFCDLFLCRQIVALRKQHGLSQKDLADRIGTRQSIVSDIENHRRASWNSETMKSIAQAFGLRLKVSFELYSTLPAEVDAFNRESLKRSPLDEDHGIHARLRRLRLHNCGLPASSPALPPLPGPASAPAASAPPGDPESKLAPITEMAVIRRLWDLASLGHEETRGSITGQIKAANTLAEIKGMKLLTKNDLEREFRDRSSEEMTFFAIHGYWPENGAETNHAQEQELRAIPPEESGWQENDIGKIEPEKNENENPLHRVVDTAPEAKPGPAVRETRAPDLPKKAAYNPDDYALKVGPYYRHPRDEGPPAGRARPNFAASPPWSNSMDPACRR